MPDSNVVFEAYPKVPLQEFVPELAFEFTEMPEDGLPFFVLRAISRIARDGNILRRTATIRTQSCVESYILDPPDCMDIVAIMGVRLVRSPGCCSGPVRRLTFEPCHIDCGTMSWFEEPNIIHFSPAKCNNVFSVNMSVTPTRHTCEVDKKLLTDYYDLVMYGTKSYLYSMADKPWSSVTRAQEYEQRFLLGIRDASVQTMLGGQRGALKAKHMRIL